jgi:diadenosine tetraphosphate (Ap4A) HIT family hydrolase
MPQARERMFALDPAFSATSHALGDLPLCHVRLQADARYAWLVLIPRVDGAVELEDLSGNDRAALAEEVVLAGGAVRAIGAALGRPVEKLNVGQLGNLTPQLHVHVVGRRTDDAAWPGPVWGVGTAEAFGPDAQAAAMTAARSSLGL